MHWSQQDQELLVQGTTSPGRLCKQPQQRTKQGRMRGTNKKPPLPLKTATKSMGKKPKQNSRSYKTCPLCAWSELRSVLATNAWEKNWTATKTVARVEQQMPSQWGHGLRRWPRGSLPALAPSLLPLSPQLLCPDGLPANSMVLEEPLWALNPRVCKQSHQHTFACRGIETGNRPSFSRSDPFF